MPPSPEFYERIRHGELGEEVKAWKRAEFANYRAFFCQVTSSKGVALRGILEPWFNVLGAGGIKIPLDADNLVSNPFLPKIVEMNQKRLGLQGIDNLDYKQIAKMLGLKIEQRYGDIDCAHLTGGYTWGYGLDFVRNLADDVLDENRNPYRRNWKRQSDASSAFGLATHFMNTFRGWEVTPITPQT